MKLSWQDHSIKYELPDKLTISIGKVLIETESQISAAA